MDETRRKVQQIIDGNYDDAVKPFLIQFQVKLDKWTTDRLDHFAEIGRINVSRLKEEWKREYYNFVQEFIKEYIDEQLDLYNTKKITKKKLNELLNVIPTLEEIKEVSEKRQNK